MRQVYWALIGFRPDNIEQVTSFVSSNCIFYIYIYFQIEVEGVDHGFTIVYSEIFLPFVQ